MKEMAEPNQQPSPLSNVDVGSGVGNSVVSDLMRVYESLTQSSTPQAEVPNASKALNLAYTNSGAPDTTMARLHQQTTEYPIPPSAFQQQHETTAKNILNITSEPGTQRIPSSFSKDGEVTSYHRQQQPTSNSDHVPVSTETAPSISMPDTNKENSYHTQRSGEEPQTILRTPSVASRTSQVSSQNIQQPAADASSESERSTTGGQSKKKRKQSQNDLVSPGIAGGGKKGGRGKKSKKEDGRWSKRFTWPEDLHRDFVSAIFDVGLKHSSPSAIMEHMPKHEQITSERVKSHLQKYRLHRVKSKKEFISSYEASLRNFQNHSHGSSSLVSGSAEIAAHLTASTLATSKTTGRGLKKGATTVSSSDLNHRSQQLHQSHNSSDSNNDSLMLPQLTEAEKASPIGAAMGYLMGLFFSLKQQLMIQRSLEAAGEKAKGNAFVSSSTMAKKSSGSSNITNNNPTAAAVAVAAGVEFVSDGAMQQPQPQNGGGSVSMRSYIEVDSMMKREMQNQMALQNKMRALKQQELDKYKNINMGAASTTVTSNTVMASVFQDSTSHLPVAATMDSNSVERNFVAGDGLNVQQTHQQERPLIGGNRTVVSTQGAGEMAGTDISARTSTTVHGQAKEGNNNLLDIDNSEDFWNTDVVDEQLFEFLMNS